MPKVKNRFRRNVQAAFGHHAMKWIGVALALRHGTQARQLG